jgi:L-seryl-tRNA(Ser) seleniumtransferase
MGVFEEWGVEPIINAAGAVTRLGGAPMPEPVLRAFCAAAQESVPLDELQAAASRTIAAATGAEAGLVTSGAAGALMLGAAAMLTGYDLGRMERLPNCGDFPHEFVVARDQRNGYDHAVRAAGARLVEVGFHEPVAGSGVRRVEAWEFAAAFSPLTAGVLYVHGAHSRPALAEVVQCAHARGLPVLVDAAGELPPHSNLRDLLATGADLVAFSGGKGLRGPQSTGILCGRRDLIAAAALQMLDLDDHFELWNPPEDLIDKKRLAGMPRHGIGRALKVSKEEIVALLVALRLFVDGAYDRDSTKTMRALLGRIAEAVETPALRFRFSVHTDELPILEISVDESLQGFSAFELCRRLRNGKPAVYVGQGGLSQGRLIINPLHLNDQRTAVFIRRFNEELAR